MTSSNHFQTGLPRWSMTVGFLGLATLSCGVQPTNPNECETSLSAQAAVPFTGTLQAVTAPFGTDGNGKVVTPVGA